jgi:trehalose/maltose hydrolase-like predicted phosphorylase
MRISHQPSPGRQIRILRWVGAVLAISLLATPAASASGPPAARGAATPSGPGAWVLTATNTGSSYAPTFTGNGLLGVRVPPTGQGYAAGTVPAQSELAGFYAQPPGQVQQRANIPTWSTLTFTDGGQPFSLTAGTTSGWRQSLDLRTGVISTTAAWTAPDGHVTQLSYQVLTDRARAHVGLVRLVITPQWSGTATVTDEIDGTPANLTTQVGKGWNPGANQDWVEVQTQGTGISAALASQLVAGGNVAATVTHLDQSTSQSVGQSVSFPVTTGTSYVFTKYVGVMSSQDAANPVTAAQTQSSVAATLGWQRLLAENRAAWATLWADRIEVRGNPSLAGIVNASEFYLWSSTRNGVNWSISPAGLSSNGYNGHIFWDAETWMYPSLLALHPDLAIGMDNYRRLRLRAAEQHAAATGYKGARFPWESALDGTEQIPPPVSVNSEGLYEVHVTADVAIAQWQYYLATGDKFWLATHGWPVIEKAAEFWASRATRGTNGAYHINGVTGPDEENPNVNDEVFTNAAARQTLLDALSAAKVLKVAAPGRWSVIASRLVILRNPRLGIHPEFRGYLGQLVKQADVTLLQYPLQYPMPRRLAQNDINYYVPRTDPMGPSMSDAIGSIDTAALGTPGCAAYVFTQRSFQPFIRDVFDQFSETRTGGAFTFMTGIGGFLQEFLYGYTGLRWSPDALVLDPSLTARLAGVTIRGLDWHGRRLTVAVGLRSTVIRLLSGRPLPVRTPSGTVTLAGARSLVIPTRRPDLSPTTDRVRCGPATASSAQPGAPALAAIDGSPATDWQPASLPATLTMAVHPAPRIRTVTVLWGHAWPPAPGPNIPPPPGPVTTVRASTYQLLGSRDRTTWRVLATVSGRGAASVDVLHLPPGGRRWRWLRLVLTASSASQPPLLQELTATP